MNDTPKTIDEQMSKERERERMDADSKAHDSGEDEEVNPNYKTCEYVKISRDENGHIEEISCLFNKDDFNWCGVPCPLTKGE